MLLTGKPPGRIFINYRRDDTAGYAGRLCDSLSQYFGDGRVFRDVDGIAAGANFEEVLKNTSQSADAMIVLIGRQWTSMVDAQGKLRLHNPDDLVVREIAAALDKKIPLYPVLIENTVMPRSEELPASLQPLVRHNAMSISDHRWLTDVTRLAKVIAIDIPGSAAERILSWVRMAIAAALFLAVAITICLVSIKWYFGYGAEPLEPALLGITFVVIVGSSMLLLLVAHLIDPPRRWYVYEAALAGLLGTLFCFILYWRLDEGLHESAAMVFGSTVIAMAVLVLMNQSGFKAR
jgi:multisubunit Na+/H+ antiporter MnhB subunit